MKFVLEFNMDSAAFEDEPRFEANRILNAVANRVALGATHGAVQDENGNTVGSFTIATDERTYPLGQYQNRHQVAVTTGEFRPPRKGEWYISGAIPEAYLAPNDLTQSFHIATIREK